MGNLSNSRWATTLAAITLWTTVGIFFRTAGGDLRDALITWYVWGLFAWLIGFVDRRLPIGKDQLRRRLLWHIPLSLLFSLLDLCVLQVISDALAHKLIPSALPAEWLAAIRGGGIHWNVPTYWLILGAHLALRYHRESQAEKEKATELERLLTEARLNTLRAQLNPHFLFNALNTVSAFVESEPQLARRMLANLGDLLRLSLDRAGQQEVTLAEDVAFLDRYVDIQRLRFGNRLQVKIDIDPALGPLVVPSLLLQPLVENAITHGLANKADTGEVSIVAKRWNAEAACILVSDNGVGLPPGWSWERDAGVGLTTTRARLAALYGAGQSLKVRNASKGVTVEIILPLRFAEPVSSEPAYVERASANR